MWPSSPGQISGIDLSNLVICQRWISQRPSFLVDKVNLLLGCIIWARLLKKVRTLFRRLYLLDYVFIFISPPGFAISNLAPLEFESQKVSPKRMRGGELSTNRISSPDSVRSFGLSTVLTEYVARLTCMMDTLNWREESDYVKCQLRSQSD